ncbi:MAG: hypothetical protein E7058_05105 [Lentisphaerae bacterium]|nr:hypothetical protein [Lentisphaerota bacterium]
MKKQLLLAVAAMAGAAVFAGVSGEGTKLKNWSQNSYKGFVRDIGKVIMDEEDQQMVFQTKTAEKGVAYYYSVGQKAKAGDKVEIEIVAKGTGSAVLQYYPYAVNPVRPLVNVKDKAFFCKMTPEGYKKYKLSKVISPEGDGAMIGQISFAIHINPNSDVIIRSFNCNVIPADEEE